MLRRCARNVWSGIWHGTVHLLESWSRWPWYVGWSFVLRGAL
jgi:hypothetical protein